MIDIFRNNSQDLQVLNSFDTLTAQLAHCYCY